MQTLYNLYAPLTQKRILQIVYQSNTITQQQFLFKNIGSRHNIVQPGLRSDLRFIYINPTVHNSRKQRCIKTNGSPIRE